MTPCLAKQSTTFWLYNLARLILRAGLNALIVEHFAIQYATQSAPWGVDLCQSYRLISLTSIPIVSPSKEIIINRLNWCFGEWGDSWGARPILKIQVQTTKMLPFLISPLEKYRQETHSTYRIAQLKLSPQSKGMI